MADFLNYIQASIRELLFTLYNALQKLLEIGNNFIDSLINTAIEFEQPAGGATTSGERKRSAACSSTSGESGSLIDFNDLTTSIPSSDEYEANETAPSTPRGSKRSSIGVLHQRDDVEQGYVYLAENNNNNNEHQPSVSVSKD